MYKRLEAGFQPGTGWAYRLHPLVKGLALIFLIMSLSLHRWTTSVTVVQLILLVLLGVSGGIDMRRCIAGLRSIALLLLVIGVAHLWSFGLAHWSGAVDAVARVVGVFLVSMMFLAITPQSELLHFWEAFFRPLGWLGLPSREIALIMVIAVRFLPVILRELDRIKLAQSARGADFSGKSGIMHYARRFLPLLVPTLVISLERSSELALAMEARGYSLHGARTQFHRYRWQTRDIIALLSLLLVVGFGLLGADGLQLVGASLLSLQRNYGSQ